MFSLRFLSSLIFTCFFLPLFAQAQESGNILFENVRVFDGKSNSLSGPVNVLIEGNKIRSIGTIPIPSAAGITKIQGNGKTLMPGLIDVHVHMAFGALTMREMMSPMLSEGLIMEKVGVGAEKMLMRGFTSVRDAGGPIFPLKMGIDAEILKMVTHDNAELLQLSGLRSPYPGKLGVVEEGALADLILVDGDPLTDLSLIANPAVKFVVIMKDGKVCKNLVQ